MKQFKRFAKIHLQPVETKQVQFQLTVEDLKYWNGNIEYVADPVDFKVFVGPGSAEVEELAFKLVE